MNKPKDIRNFTRQEFENFVSSFDMIMSDCDGVLWTGTTPINGAFETLKMFQSLGKKIMFVSNNTTRSVDKYVNKFQTMGYEVTPDCINIPTLSIVWYLKKIGFQSKVLAIGSKSFIKLLMDNGLDVVTLPNNIEENEVIVHNLLSNPPEVGAIIMDFDLNLNILKISQLQMLLKKKDILFLVGTRDTMVPVSKTHSILGLGRFIDMIIECTGREPIEFAKPSEVLKDYLFDRYLITKPDRCLFIGDSLTTDMKFAEQCGFLRLWVGSGVDDIDTMYSTCIIPDYYLPSLGLMPKFKNT